MSNESHSVVAQVSVNESAKKPEDGSRFIGAVENIRIGRKIFFGFCIVLAILIIIVAMSNNSTAIFRQAFVQQLEQSEEAREIFDIDRRVSDLQKYILIYSHTGQLGSVTRAKDIDAQLLKDLKALKNKYETEDETASEGSSVNEIKESIHLIDNMISIIKSVPAKLDDLVGERTRSVALVNTELSLSASAIESELDRIRSSTDAKRHPEFLAEIDRFERRFVKLQREMLTFFHNREFGLLDSIKKTFIEQKAELEHLRTHFFDESTALVSRQLETSHNNYQDLFYRAVQANRGYLFLVNVVLAGESSEFLQLSSRLRTLSFKKVKETSELSQKRIENRQFAANIGSIIAILFGLLLSFLIGTSIAAPLTKITAALTDLAKGNSNTQVPGVHRGDEVGQIARAANVFKETNIKTKHLLEQTQSLARDVLAREQLLEAKTAELEKSNQDLDSFAYVASHDLKSPLRGIDNLAAWIAEDCEEILPPASADHLTTLRSRIKRMENLLVDLLQYSRVGRVESFVEEVDVEALVVSTFDLIDKPECSELSILPGLLTITTQKSPLQQVFLNLFTNAIKYSDKNCPKIEVGARKIGDGFIEFSVVDDGPGIDEVYHEKIFQMFQTLQARDVVESSGMGLAIVRRVIEGFGGEITLKSSSGEGATFRFTWPERIAAEAQL